jgi:predicted AAA+ superfamily ATPase
MIQRAINIQDLCLPGKTLLIMGPRRSGKTTLLQEFLRTSSQTSILFDGNNLSTQHLFSRNEFSELQPAFAGYDILAIDEAQNIANIGMSLKIINDQSPQTSVIATGSSSFDLRNQVGEPLVGRKNTHVLYPFAIPEILRADSAVSASVQWARSQESFLRYGLYPDVVTATTNKEREHFLRELIDSLLLRDILMYQDVKGSDVLVQLLLLLSYQIGNEMSLTELGSNLGIRKETVARYLDLLEKSYIIFRLKGLSRNMRSEVTRKAKYYFYDVGVRNALINNFNPLAKRNDQGALWENFALVERLKMRSYRPLYANQYFWRTWNKNEIDLIEERDGSYFAYEMKSKPGQTARVPAEWVQAYGPHTHFQTITPDNFLDFVSWNLR